MCGLFYIISWGRGVVCGEKMEKGWWRTLNGTIGRGDSHGGKDLGDEGGDSNPTGQHEFFLKWHPH